MKICQFVLLLSMCLVAADGLKLVNNGYEDLRVVIMDSVVENDQIIERIKVIFKDASELLYKATNRQTYFRSVVISVPHTWTNKSSYETVAPLSSKTSHIRVGAGGMTTPVTVGSNSCGQEGLYTFLHYKEFILKENVTKWGPHASVLLHEWGHLRWGLKDEYPTVRKGSGITWKFQPANGEWKPVGCSRKIQGYASTTCKSGIPEGKCDVTDIYNVLEKDCKFCPDLIQPLQTSIMAFQYIPSVFKFCDKDDEDTPEDQRHDSESINEQNIYCNGKSAWEVMREHEDFKNGENPSLSDEHPPPTEFFLVQETSDKVRVLVLDSSGSMRGDDKIENLYQASKRLIENILPAGSWLSMVDFDSDATLISEFVQINNKSKQELVDVLPRTGSGSTCIRCGLETALEALKDLKAIASTEESELILISDGKDVKGGWESATSKLQDAGVVVHSIAVTQDADTRLESISSRTGGRVFTYTGEGIISLASILNEIISGGSVTGSSAAATISNEQVSASENTPVVINFNIEEGMGKETTVSVLANSYTSIEIKLLGPGKFTQSESGANVKTLTLILEGISEPGTYMALITSSTFTNMEVFVTSKPTSLDAEIIRSSVQLSTNQVDFKKTDSFQVMYASLRKGESSIKYAIVTAIIYGPSGTKTCELQLLDDGNEPDIKSGDGIYTTYIHPGCHGDNGRHNSKVVITGNEHTVVSLYSSAKSAVIDEETVPVTETATGNFERVNVPESYTVSNYDTVFSALDNTPPGRITDIEVIGMHSDEVSTERIRYYTMTWTATGDDLNVGQASSYEMGISTNLNQLRNDFTNVKLIITSTEVTTPFVAGKVERLKMVVRFNGSDISTTFFAIVAVDEVGNRGPVSNIIAITVGGSSSFEVYKEECTDNCYDVKTVAECTAENIPGSSRTPTMTTYAIYDTVVYICDDGFEFVNGSLERTCIGSDLWSGNVPLCKEINPRSSGSVSQTTIVIICVCILLFVLFLLGFVAFVVKSINKQKTEVQCQAEETKVHWIALHTPWTDDDKWIGFHKRDDTLVTID